jgi:putative Mg2+ transporter-C (MgtC) family protein
VGSWWDEIVANFSDLPSSEFIVRLALRLSMAALLGGALGFERKRAGKSAGLRTHMLVSLGSALFVVVPQQAGVSTADLSRVIQGVISGMGFLGAGAILKRSDDAEVKGLTTAAGLWLTCAIGIAVGLGREASAALGTLLALLILTAVGRVSSRLEQDKRSGLD